MRTTNDRKVLTSYITTALWAGLDDNDEPLDDNYSHSDVPPEELTKLKTMIAKFLDMVGPDTIDRYLDDHDLAQLGHDLFLTQNGHGAGFWDRNYSTEDLGNILTKASKALGECNPYVGDDGRIYFYNN